jgi:hypothetical protein
MERSVATQEGHIVEGEVQGILLVDCESVAIDAGRWKSSNRRR